MAVQMEKPMRVTSHHAVTSCEGWCWVRRIFSSELSSRNETRSQSGRYLSQHCSQGCQLVQEKLWGSWDSPRNTHGRRISPAGPGRAPGEEPPRCLPTEFSPVSQQVKPILGNTREKVDFLPSKPPSSPPAHQLHPESAALN